MFAGMTMRAFARPNLSTKARVYIDVLLKVSVTAMSVTAMSVTALILTAISVTDNQHEVSRAW